MPPAAVPVPPAGYVVGVTCLGAFIGQLDASIVQLALPALERHFAAPLHVVGWVSVAYSLAFAAALPVFARRAEIAGRRGMYLAGFALFALFSALCGLAPDLGALIALRAAQGVAGAMLGANSVVIMVAAAGPAGRARAMGWFAATQAIGVSAGPAIGGLLLQGLSWHWIFWVTVPVALLGLLAGARLVPHPPRPGTPGRLDWPGALLLVPALVALLLAITRLHAWGPLSPGVLGSAGLALALLAGFLAWERRCAAPLLDLGLFRRPAFAGGMVAVLLSYAMLYGMFFGMSFALARGDGEDPLTAGLHLAVVPVALGLVAPFGAALAERRPVATRLAGMALAAIAALALAWLLEAASAGPARLMPALAAYGVGLGLFIAPSNSATLAAAPQERSGQAGGLLNLMRALGTALGVAMASTLLAWRLAPPGDPTVHTAAMPAAAVLAAAGSVMLLQAGLAVLAALASLAGAAPRAASSAGPARSGA